MASRLGISRRSENIGQGREIGPQEGRNSLQSIRHSHKYAPHTVLRQHLPCSNICKANSKRSAAKQVQYSSVFSFITASVNLHIIDVDAGDVVSLHVHLQQHLRCSRRTSISDKLQGSHLLVDGANIKETKEIFKKTQLFIAVAKSFIVIHKLKRIKERK